MKTTDEIQEEYAKSKNYESFADLLLSTDRGDINWHVSCVQKEFAKELTKQSLVKILSVETIADGKTFSLGDTIKFSDKWDNFVLQHIKYNAYERRIELHGEGFFCTLLESKHENLSTI